MENKGAINSNHLVAKDDASTYCNSSKENAKAPKISPNPNAMCHVLVGYNSLKIVTCTH